MKRASPKLVLLIAAGVLVLAIGGYVWTGRLAYRVQMQPIYSVISDGEMGWAGVASDRLNLIMVQSPDRHTLAERLLAERDGSLVAEGMLLAVRSNHPRARELVQQHLTDTRWNWSLLGNDDLAKQLLLCLDHQPIEPWVQSWLNRTKLEAQ